MKKRTSLHPQTLRVQNRLVNWTKQGRKHWDLFRWLCDPFILCDAINKVIENAGSAGLDGQKVEDLKGQEWQHALKLSEKLKSRSYKPGAVRRVFIPKSDGKLRPLGIPDRDDRIVQTALVLLLEPIYEQIFLPCSYGFRPGKRAMDCAADVANSVFQHRHVLEADIESFFDKVSHNKLMGMLKGQIVDPRILKLIRQILKTGYQEINKPWEPSPEGTPQGSPLSPMLANIYLHYCLDEKFMWLKSHKLSIEIFRFADDFVIVAKKKSELDLVQRWLIEWMADARLNLKASKTRKVNMQNRYRSHESKFDFLGFKFHLRAFKDNPKRFWIARQPSEKSRKKLHENLEKTLRPNLSLKEAKEKSDAIWRGWAGYFRFSNANRVFYREVKSVYRAHGLYLRRKFRHQRRPVPWRKLTPLRKWLRRDTRPIRVIPDLVRQRQQQQMLF